MKILSVVGARPQFVKLAPIHRAVLNSGHHHVIVHTGQHYDPLLSDVFFSELGIPEPDDNLHVGSGSHATQTAAMMVGLEQAFDRHKPDWVLVYGDTNSTLAAALVAIKLHVRVAHLEAGLRSFNRMMPEEHNRILTDHASDLLLAPTAVAMKHLEREGLASKSVLVGDVMTDVCFNTHEKVVNLPPMLPENWPITNDWVIATIHRQENTDSETRLRQIVSYLAESAHPICLLVHPRLRDIAQKFRIELNVGSIRTFEPLNYSQLVWSLSNCVGVITDSGGIQKEAFLLGAPCITLRTETEWTETVDLGWNTLIPNCDQSINSVFSKTYVSEDSRPYGQGRAAEEVVLQLERTANGK